VRLARICLMASEGETAIVVELPELDAVLDEHRWALDPSRRWGMPAHLTVLYPFVSPASVDGDTLVRLNEAVTEVIPFEAEFGGFGWFADQVAWLAPSDPESFKNLIRRLTNAFPECPPYGGAHDEIVPHVTIGEGKAVDLLSAATDAIRPRLPVKMRVTSLSLMEGSTAPGSWRVIERVALGGRDDSGHIDPVWL
jgi:2'-5' RNA ligase